LEIEVAYSCLVII